MSYNRFEPFSIENALPAKEIEGETYTRFQPISATNPYPVMVIDLDAYTTLEPVSESNPLPIATGDGSYSIFEPLADDNRLPVVIVEGQSYNPNDPVSMTNPYPVINTTEASYTGPLDLVPGAVVAYSQRAMTDGSTANAIRIRRSSDNAEQTFALVNNAVDVAAVTTFLGGSDPFVRTWFDLSGNAKDAGQATANLQPPWTADASNSKPSVGTFDDDALATALDLDYGSTYTVLVVGKMLGGAICGVNGDSGAAWFAVGTFVGDGGSAAGLGCVIYDGAATEYAEIYVEAAMPVLESYFVADLTLSTSANGTLLVNGATQTVVNDRSGNPIAFSAPLILGNDGSNIFNGEILELLIYDSVLSSENRTALRQNLATYYGISL